MSSSYRGMAMSLAVRTRPVLILGGTAEAYALAAALVSEGHDVVTSLAGVTQEPHLPPGRIRRGGFGGSDGLRDYLHGENISALLDATHPFAAQMSRQAHEAANALGLPLLRLERPPWAKTDGDDWIEVQTVNEAVAALPPDARVLVTIGRKEVAAFFARADIGGVARMIEPYGNQLNPNWQIVYDRPPYAISRETELITHHTITHLVTKNSGSEATEAKITAARRLQLPVIMVRRPLKPGVPTFPTVKEIVVAFKRALLP